MFEVEDNRLLLETEYLRLRAYCRTVVEAFHAKSAENRRLRASPIFIDVPAPIEQSPQLQGVR